MSSAGKIMDIARRALAAQQTGLTITGHNIANVNTPGYSRQRLTLQSNTPALTEWGFIGTGVSIQSIGRIRDGFVDAEIRSEKQDLGRWLYRERIMSEIEDVFNEPSDTGLAAVMNDFWDSWGELSNNPQSVSARQWVQQVGIHLVNTFNHLHERLTDLQANLNNELQLGLEEVNTILHQIGDLNEKITYSESKGVVANDYRDRRDLLLEQLSELVGVRATERDDGMVTITLSGQVLLERNMVNELGTRERGINYIAVSDPTWSVDKSPVSLVNGRLHGIIEMRDEVIVEQFDQLDELANTLVDRVNALHQTGFGLNGSTTGIDFFDSNTTGARNIALDINVLSDANMIAASADGTPGDGSIAMDIFDLREARILSGDTVTADEYFAAMMGNLGVRSQEATFMRENQELMVQQLQNQQSSISGVSLDEEMTNLIKYQHAYEAAARLITTVDEMMQTILDMV